MKTSRYPIKLCVLVALVASCASVGQTAPDGQSDASPAPVYSEKYRPQFHFSSATNWLNDPNGLVFYKGEYHLFFQHNPKGLAHANMSWGHAVGTDLVHWTQVSHALLPDENGAIWSGSGVVDWLNTSGFGQHGTPPLVLIYTQTKPFAQSIAWSVDGRTFTKYEHNPVLPLIAGGNRDPKVIWHEPTKRWIMILSVKKDQYDLFGSPDLKTWTTLSPIAFKGAFECPDLFPLPLDGDAKKIKWVVVSAGGGYVIGTFDGHEFNIEQGPIASKYGYAVQTFSDEPRGRRIQIAWLNSGKNEYPGMPFRQQLSVPLELTLRTTPEGPRLFRQPIAELAALRTKLHAWQNQPLAAGQNLLAGLSHDLYDIEGELEAETAKSITFKVRGQNVPIHFENGRAKFRVLVDRIIIESFENGGARSQAVTFTPDDHAAPLELTATGTEAKIVSLKVYELESIWKSKLASAPM